MRLRRIWFGTRLLIGNYTFSGDREPRPALITTANGAQFELYEPKQKVRKTILLNYGVSTMGEEDPRLIRLVRSCTATGLRVAVPILHGLKTLQLELSDLADVRDCIEYLLASYPEPFGIIAFSTGGSFALTLSTEPKFAKQISIIALFSPIYDLRATWHYIDALAHKPIINAEDDNEVWLQYITAYRNYKLLGYTEAERDMIMDHLRRYTHGLSAEEKNSFFQNVLVKHPLNGQILHMEEEVFDALSPCGKLVQSHARVVVIHDANDFLVPPEHAQALAQELSQRTPPNNRLLITPVLSHVTIEHLEYIRDIFHMIDILGELFT